MMTAPILQIIWSHRILFLVIMIATFIVFAFVMFTLPKRVTVRSSIEVGSAAAGDKQESVESPENIARWIPRVYGPAALLAMADKDVSASALGALQNPSVESVGRFVVISNTVDPSFENDAKDFQKTIADLVIKELAQRARALREAIEARTALATEVSSNLDQQIKEDGGEIERIGALTEELRGQLDRLRVNLAALYQRTGTATLQPGESATLEAHIRELHEQIANQTNLIGNLTLERFRLVNDLAKTRRRREAQSKAVAEAEFEKNSLKETRISLPPTLMPAADPNRRLSLLLVGFAISLLAGFGTVVLSHNMGTRRS